MTERTNDPNVDRDNVETLESERRSGISADQQHGTGHNEGAIHYNDMEDQLRTDIGVDATADTDEHTHIQDGGVEEELQEDVGLKDTRTDEEASDR